MGNAASSSDSDDDLNFDQQEEDGGLETECDQQRDPASTLDLGSLFDPGTLRSTASKIKEDVKENLIQTHQAFLVRYLEERLQRNEETINLSQFIDSLTVRLASRDDCIQAFQQFDCRGDGTADVSTMLETLKSTNGAHSKGELASVVRTLQACTLTPGFIDVYNEDKSTIDRHGARILNFLLRNRSCSCSLPFPCLNGFSNTMHMRTRVLKHHFQKLKDNEGTLDHSSSVNTDDARPISKCFSSYEVSSNSHEAFRMFNGDNSTFWQSDGNARSHWIRLRIKSNVVIKQLSIYVSSSDQSYMPELVAVSHAKSASHTMKKIREINIASHVTGSVMLLENAKVHYPVIQINIRRCHNDGCDVRIHGIKIIGYRVQKEASTLSLTDASVGWYLQMLATTTMAGLPSAPHLRKAIIEHTRTALKSMAPLSLSPGNSEKPSFLSAHVMHEMDSFIQQMAVDDQNQMTSDGLHLWLSFSLARGHVANILQCLKCMHESGGIEIESASLMKSLNTIRDNCLKKHGSPVNLKLAGCDGGQKEDGAAPQCVANNLSVMEGYWSAPGKTKVNMVFESQEFVQITKIRMKVVKGPRGPKRGLVFVYKHDEEFNLEDHVNLMSGYDGWGEGEYSFCSMVRSTGIGGKPDNPVAYFTLEEEWDEIEVPMDTCCVGKYVMIKFLEPRLASVDCIGIYGIKFYGFQRKSVFVSSIDVDKTSPLPEKDVGSIGLDTAAPRLLSFLVSLARDHTVLMQAGTLDLNGVSVELLLSLFRALSSSYLCRNLLLQLTHALFPYLIQLKSVDDHSKELSKAFFKELTSLVDQLHSSENIEDSHLVSVARQVIIDGAAVFFPDKEARRKQLFAMMNDVNTSLESPSVTLTFQSLCQFFSSVDPSSLLDLPEKPTKDYNPEPVLTVMDTLLTVAHREFQHVTRTQQTSEQASHLVTLLCSLQTSLTAWCFMQIKGEKEASSSVAQEILVKYVILAAGKSSKALEDFLQLDEKQKSALMSIMESSFLSTSLRQLILILIFLSDDLTSVHRTKLLHNLLPIAKELKLIAPSLPSHFYPLESENWKEIEKGIVTLRAWELESPHHYHNNQHDLQVFSCMGASVFVVEFDERCDTEKRYDYLEFTDALGNKSRYDHKVGTDKWPLKVTFHGGHWLQFLFHSDSSNTEWGYKFKVTAMGSPDVPLCWMFDLQLSVAKLFGRLCGATLTVNRGLSLSDSHLEEESELFRSELWTTLFRGGYRVGKLQRSLSGKHVADDDSEAGNLLWSMVEKTDEMGTEFHQKCSDYYATQSSVTLLGGEDIASAVTAVFAALIWHTQPLREDLQKYAKSGGETRITEGLHQAFSQAQTLRTFLIDKKQKQRIEAEKLGKAEVEFDPVAACREKALYLLKFSGLSKLHLRSETKAKLERRSSKVNNRLASERIGRPEKHVSLRLVLSFVIDAAWSKANVEQLLQKRTQHAQCVAEVYLWASEYLRLMSENNSLLQLPIIQFLRDLFSYQNKFPQHYADGLDGCGLNNEAKVRTAFYALVRRMVDFVRNTKRMELSRPLLMAHDFIQVCALHLMDINWQLYDLSLLVDLKMPELFFTMARESVTLREKVVSETNEAKEIKNYQGCMAWLKECRDGFVDWYERQTRKTDKDDRMMVQMFVARFCDLLDVEISCDGCGVTLPGRRYRCLQCPDMDLCATCYTGGVKPIGEHTEDHEMVHLMFKCDECQGFIVGTRIHCSVCEDFDLCLGCQNSGSFPAGHSTEHEVVRHPLTKWKLDTDIDSSLTSYLHQHVWLLFSSLALSMANVLYNASQNMVDVDYIKAATTLHGQCIDLAIKCLMGNSTLSVVEEEDDAESLSLRLARQEDAFAVHSQERIMGLLGAMIPAENQGPLAEDVSIAFFSEEFLTLLFSIAKRETDHETNTQHFATGLIGQLLQRSCISCKVVDRAVGCSESSSSEEETDTETPPQVDGEKTAEFLFSFGALCLERSGLEWANSMSGILQRLFNSPCWREVLLEQLSKCIQDLKTEPQLSSIFALFVVADFPEVLSIGSHVKYSDHGVEYKYGVVLKQFTDKNGTILVDLKSRRRRTIKCDEDFIECVSHDIQALQSSHIKSFIDVITNIISKYNKGCQTSVESCWVLALSLKALIKSLRSSSSILKVAKTDDQAAVIEALYDKAFVQCIVSLATRGTGFSKQWLLKDLEVLSLMLYTREHEMQEEDAESTKPKTQVTEEVVEEGADDPLKGLDETARLCFQTMHDHFGVPMTMLRAIYDMHNQDTNALLVAVHENIDGTSFKASEKFNALAKQWKIKKELSAVEQAVDRAVDVGLFLKTPAQSKRCTFEKATPEIGEDNQKLILTDNDRHGDNMKQRKGISAQLLKRELDQHGRSASREYLIKVNMALSVMFARQVLAALLADWPSSGHVIHAEFIGCGDQSHIPIVLDLLNRNETKETFQKVVHNVVKHCELQELVPIALTSCQFMEEVNLSTVMRESEHSYKGNTEFSDKVHIPGASTLFIKFDSRCSTADSCDCLTMSSSADFEENKHSFSGTSIKSWQDFELPGMSFNPKTLKFKGKRDTLYYKFESENDDDDWGYSFTVTGGRMGRFNTGYMVLNEILCLPSVSKLLPIGELWSILVYVACKQTGQQRLKALQLLLRLLQSASQEKVQVDVSELAPLWHLYNELSADSVDGSCMVSPVVRGLTELFFVAENLAAEWGMIDHYVASLKSKNDIMKAIHQGLMNVAAVSLSIGVENKATKAFKKKGEKPPLSLADLDETDKIKEYLEQPFVF